VKRFGGLVTPIGESFVAIGFIVIASSLIAFAVVDFWILIAGSLPSLNLRVAWYLALSVVAALFSVVCVFIWRPLLAKLAISLFSISLASHSLERFIRIPMPQLRLLAACRLLVSLGVVLLVLRFRSSGRDTVGSEET